MCVCVMGDMGDSGSSGGACPGHHARACGSQKNPSPDCLLREISSEFPQQPESQLVLTQQPDCQILGGQGKVHTGPHH